MKASQIVGALVLCALAVNVGVYYEAGRKAGERPPLTYGLTGKWGTISADFANRLKQDHPVGSSATAFTADLAGQGFKSKNWGIVPGGIGEANLDESNWVCNQGAQVRWSVDGSGRLTKVQGKYDERGCL